MIKRTHKFLLVIFLTLFSVTLLTAGVAYYLITSPTGVRLAVNYALLHSAQYASVTVESFSGTLARGLTLERVQIRNWPALPGAVIRLQRLEARMLSLNWRDLWVNVFNGRMDLPNCEPLVFNGRYTAGQVQGSAFSRGLDAAVIMQPFMSPEIWRNLQGAVSKVDFTFAGDLMQPRLKGYFRADRIKYASTVVKDGIAHFDLTPSRNSEGWQLEGALRLENGLVIVRQKTIELEPSKAVFKGDAANPSLAINGTTKANEYTIDFKITGTLRQPKVQVHSDPYLPEDMALVALDMNNWLPTDLTSPYNRSLQEVGFRRRVIEDVNVGFGLKQSPTSPGVQEQTNYSKMLEGQLSLTDNISFNVAEEVFHSGTEGGDPGNSDESRNQKESLFYLKYKNLF